MKKTLLHGTDGYTFIELLIAITILGFVITPFLALFTGCFSSITLAGRQSIAINLGREKMESVKALGYDAVYDDYITNVGLPHTEDNIPPNTGFRRITEVNPLLFETAGNPGHILNLLQVKVTVYWILHNKEYSETVESYLACR